MSHIYSLINIKEIRDMTNIGYARVSSVGQSLDIQVAALKAAGCDNEHIFKEKRTGTNAERPELKDMLRFCRKGDTLFVTRLDRLGRSVLDLAQIVKQLEEKCVQLVLLEQSIDTRTPQGKAMFGMMSVFAEFETELRKERQLEGIAAAKRRLEAGDKEQEPFGRKPTLSEQDVEELRKAKADGKSVPELMKHYGVSRATVYRALTEH